MSQIADCLNTNFNFVKLNQQRRKSKNSESALANSIGKWRSIKTKLPLHLNK
jgi:hypothetical protein